ncbi:unnamed protein product [Durusdinium trenchii]
MQLGLQDDELFAELLSAIEEAIPELDQKGLSRVLMGLGDTHEDLPFGHSTTPQEHLQRLFSLVEAACAKLLSDWEAPAASLDDRDLGFPLFALSRLGIYNQEVFDTASRLLTSKLSGQPPLPVQGLRQWLLACNSLSHSLTQHAEAITAYEPPQPWTSEEDSRLHQMAGALAHLPDPNPLLANVLQEVIRRPASQLRSSKAVALYGLQVVRLLIEAGCVPSTVSFPAELGRELDHSLEQKSKVVRRCSHLENKVGHVLTNCGFEPRHDVVPRAGLSADFFCHWEAKKISFFLEVDGPSHFCVRPFWRRRGRAVLKQRVFASQGWPLVSIPYWIAAPPGAYARRGGPRKMPSLELNEEEVKQTIAEQLDTWSSSNPPHVRQWWAESVSGQKATALTLLFDRPLPPSAPAVAAALGACGKSGAWQHAVSCLESVEAGKGELNATSFGIAVNACARNDEVNASLSLLRRAHSRDLEPGLLAYTSFLSACGRTLSWETAVMMMRMMKDRSLQPDAVCINAALSSLGASGQWHLALHVFDEVKRMAQLALSRGSPAARLLDVGVVNTAANACERSSQWRTALKLFHELCSRSMGLGIRPDTVTFNVAISSWGQGLHWKHALKILAHMRYWEKMPDEVTYSSAISACERSLQWMHALALLDMMRCQALPPNLLCYGAAVGAGDWRFAFQLLEAIKTERLEPTTICFNAVGASQSG